MKPLEDGLERILEHKRLPDSGTDLGRFLIQHPHTRQQVTDMLEISGLIQKHFRVSEAEAEEIAPAAGFYARVMARLEAEAAQQTFWSFFVDPFFTRRLVLATGALAVLMGAIVLLEPAPEPDAHFAQAPAIQIADEPMYGAVLVSNESELPVEESTDVEADRGAALMQLTTYNQ
jgi:hypothetical protein